MEGCKKPERVQLSLTIKKKKHGCLKRGEKFEDYFDIIIIKSYKKPMNRNIEEETFLINYQG